MVRHKDASLNIDNERLQAVFVLPGAPASARCAPGIIGRPNQLRAFIQILIDFLFFPNVISRGKDIDSRSQKFVSAFYIYAYAAGGVLRIGNRQINSFGLDQ